MIPHQLLSRMGIYNLPVYCCNNLKVVVSDDEAIVADSLKKLKSSLSNSVVAVDLKPLPNYAVSRTAKATYIKNQICYATDQVSYITNEVVELGHLAARALKKHGMMECRCLKTLACEDGVELKQEPTLGGELSWNEGILSQNEVEYATHRALSTFLVAEKLLDSIP